MKPRRKKSKRKTEAKKRMRKRTCKNVKRREDSTRDEEKKVGSTSKETSGKRTGKTRYLLDEAMKLVGEEKKGEKKEGRW